METCRSSSENCAYLASTYEDLELLIIIPNSIPQETIKNILKEAMVKVNQALQLNVTIEIDTQVGSRYSDCH